jgi:hypothetical protein
MNILLTHTPAFIPFLANIEIGRDEADFDLDHIEIENVNRRFQTSKLVPMSANIVFIMYSCGDKLSDFKLRAFLNENLIKLDACQTVDCRFDEIQSYLNSLISHCVSTKSVCSLE